MSVSAREEHPRARLALVALLCVAVVACASAPSALRGCRHLWSDDTTGERVWECPGGDRCCELAGFIGCYRRPPSGVPVPLIEPYAECGPGVRR